MTKVVLANALAGALGVPMVHAKEGVDAISNAIEKSLKETGTFSLPGFGTFNVTARKAHKARNPRTGETIKAGASRNVRFKASPVLKKAVARAKLKSKATAEAVS
jgi:DNA-binding protein HU-beta